MKRGIRLGLSVAMVAAFVAALAAPVGAAPSPFPGAWTSIDADGSSQRLTIGGGTSPRVQLLDDGATVCGVDENDDPIWAARATGRGGVAGDVLTVDLDLYCQARPTYFLDTFTGLEFIYDAATGTLTDGFGVVWSRASG